MHVHTNVIHWTLNQWNQQKKFGERRPPSPNWRHWFDQISWFSFSCCSHNGTRSWVWIVFAPCVVLTSLLYSLPFWWRSNFFFILNFPSSYFFNFPSRPAPLRCFRGRPIELFWSIFRCFHDRCKAPGDPDVPFPFFRFETFQSWIQEQKEKIEWNG